MRLNKKIHWYKNKQLRRSYSYFSLIFKMVHLRFKFHKGKQNNSYINITEFRQIASGVCISFHHHHLIIIIWSSSSSLSSCLLVKETIQQKHC